MQSPCVRHASTRTPPPPLQSFLHSEPTTVPSSESQQACAPGGQFEGPSQVRVAPAHPALGAWHVAVPFARMQQTAGDAQLAVPHVIAGGVGIAPSALASGRGDGVDESTGGVEASFRATGVPGPEDTGAGPAASSLVDTEASEGAGVAPEPSLSALTPTLASLAACAPPSPSIEKVGPAPHADTEQARQTTAAREAAKGDFIPPLRAQLARWLQLFLRPDEGRFS